MSQDLEELVLLTKGNEYEGHIQGKKRLSKILRKRGFYTWYEVDTIPTETEIGTRSYTIDVLGVWQYDNGTVTEIAFEVDGFKGHNSKRQRDRDKFRDRVHWEYQRLPTVRLLRPWLAGKSKVSDDDIMIEIVWQLKTKYGIRI
jgi:hypothetical protein